MKSFNLTLPSLHRSAANGADEVMWHLLDDRQKAQASKVHAADPQGGEIEIERCRFFIDSHGHVVPGRGMTVD